MKTIAIMGSGLTAHLSALVLSRHTDEVLLMSSEATIVKDRPLVLLSPAIDFLQSELPDVYQDLLQQGAWKSNIDEVHRQRFPQEMPTGDETPFLCCRSSFLESILRIRLEWTANVRRCSPESPVWRNANLVVDATGSHPQWKSAPRQKIGTDYVALIQFFEVEDNAKIPFALMSQHGVRGGIYPQERNVFAVSFTIPQHLGVNEETAEKFLQAQLEALPEAKHLVEHSRRLSPLHLIGGLSNHRWKENQDPRIFAVGEARVSCVPAFGRNLSLACWHLKALLSRLSKENAAVSESYLKNSDSYWRQAAFGDQADDPQFSLSAMAGRAARTYYNRVFKPLYENHPLFYRDLLRHYQLQIPAQQLFSVRAHARALKTWFRVTEGDHRDF